MEKSVFFLLKSKFFYSKIRFFSLKINSYIFKLVQASGYTFLFTGQFYTEDYITFTDVFLQVNFTLRITLHLQMLFMQFEDQQVAPHT